MIITSDHVARALTDYLRQRASLAQIVDWAEAAMLDGEFTVCIRPMPEVNCGYGSGLSTARSIWPSS